MSEALRQKLEQHGAHILTVDELLTLILRTGRTDTESPPIGEALMAHFGSLRELGRCDYADLVHVHQLRPTQAAQLMAAIELGRRFASHPDTTRPRVESAEDAAQLLMLSMEALKQEELRVILLDARRRVIAIPTIYIGSLAATIIRIPELFREAIARNAASLILVHNHPSGDATPSQADLDLTRQIIKAGKLLDINVLDHVILGHGEWVSLREMGVAF